MDGIEQTSLKQYFPGWFLLNVALHYHRETQRLSYWQVWGIFFEDFHAHIGAVKSLILWSVSTF